MYESSCDQNACAEVLGTKEEGRRDAKAWELGNQDRKCTSSRGDKQDDEKPSDMETQVVVWLRRASLASSPPVIAVNGGRACKVSAQPDRLHSRLLCRCTLK